MSNKIGNEVAKPSQSGTVKPYTLAEQVQALGTLVGLFAVIIIGAVAFS